MDASTEIRVLVPNSKGPGGIEALNTFEPALANDRDETRRSGLVEDLTAARS